MYLKLLRSDSIIYFRVSAIISANYCNIGNVSQFKKDLKGANKIAVITGRGISAESGLLTYRSGHIWRNYQSSSLSTPEAFTENPSLVWEFYHYKRELALKARPNAAHKALVEYESKHPNKKITIITQNEDNLHKLAGSKIVVELNGNLLRTRCTKCNDVQENFDSPICKALAARETSQDPILPKIPEHLLPHCKKCNGLLRPDTRWHGEKIPTHVLNQAEGAIDTCQVCLVIGTSSVMYPAASWPPRAFLKGAIVAEFNIEPSPLTEEITYYFSGPAGLTVPFLLSR